MANDLCNNRPQLQLENRQPLTLGCVFRRLTSLDAGFRRLQLIQPESNLTPAALRLWIVSFYRIYSRDGAVSTPACWSADTPSYLLSPLPFLLFRFSSSSSWNLRRHYLAKFRSQARHKLPWEHPPRRHWCLRACCQGAPVMM